MVTSVQLFAIVYHYKKYGIRKSDPDNKNSAFKSISLHLVHSGLCRNDFHFKDPRCVIGPEWRFMAHFMISFTFR